MRRVCTALLGCMLLGLSTAPAAFAQEPITAFDALSARLSVGDRVWVTTATGREQHGRLEQLSLDSLTISGHPAVTVQARDVVRIRRRDHDSVKNGALIGLSVGAALGTVWCVGAIADTSGDLDARVECGEGFTVFPAFATLTGLVVDLVIPGRVREVYRVGAPAQASALRIGVSPLMRRGQRGIALALQF